MAFVKSTSPVSSMKNNKPTAKRAASSSKAVKFDVPTKSKPQDATHDRALQSTEKRRRYMRRGSKTPSMLMKAYAKFDFEPELLDTKNAAEYGAEKQRRMSLMSALKLSLEQTAIEPKLPVQINRMSTYDLLSQL